LSRIAIILKQFISSKGEATDGRNVLPIFDNHVRISAIPG
jgi:hypothetical protein